MIAWGSFIILVPFDTAVVDRHTTCFALPYIYLAMRSNRTPVVPLVAHTC